MNILNWIEDQVNKIVPKVEVTGRSEKKFTKETYKSLMNELITELQLKLRSSSGTVYHLCFSGKTIGELSQVKVLLAKKANPEMYKSMKSRYKCILTDDGTIEVTSFEHMAGFKKERIAFKKNLARRLNLFLGLINEK